MFVPTHRLVAVLAAASVLPWFGGLVAMIGVDLVVAAFAFADWRAAARAEDVAIVRHLPGDIVLFKKAQLRWTVANNSDRAFKIRVADEIAPSLRAARRFEVTVAPGKSELVRTLLEPQRRGSFILDEIVCRTTGPMGLASRQFALSRPEEIRVTPAFRSRKLVEQRLVRTQAIRMGRRLTRGKSSGTEFDQLRDYTPDDEIRRVDWAATARSGRPIVRDYMAEQNQQVVCLLDNGRLMAPRVQGVTRLEHAMDAALAVTTIATYMGDRAGLVAFDQKVRVTVAPSRRPDQVDRVATSIFDLEPVLAESHYSLAFNQVSSHFRRRSLLVLLTDLVPAALEESLLPALPLLRRRHVVMIGAVQDPEVLALSTQAVVDVESAHSRSAGISHISERRTASRKLVANGAIVIDKPPGELAEALVDAYLEIKASSRL